MYWLNQVSELESFLNAYHSSWINKVHEIISYLTVNATSVCSEGILLYKPPFRFLCMSKTSVLSCSFLVARLFNSSFLPFSSENEKKWILHEIINFLLASHTDCGAQETQSNINNLLSDDYGRQERRGINSPKISMKTFSWQLF